MEQANVGYLTIKRVKSLECYLVYMEFLIKPRVVFIPDPPLYFRSLTCLLYEVSLSYLFLVFKPTHSRLAKCIFHFIMFIEQG